MGWQDVGKNAGGKDFLKIADREKVVIHVLGENVGGPAEPKSFYQYFNQTLNRGIVVPDSYTGQVERRMQHAFLIWSFRDGAPRVWAMGNNLAAQIKGLYDAYDGSLESVDITVTRQGTGKTTKYILAPKPTQFDASVLEGVTLPDLDATFAEGTEQDIENLKNGIAPDENNDAPADNGQQAEPPAEEPPAEDAPTGDAPADDDEAALQAQLAAIQAKKKAAAANNGKSTGTTATLEKPKAGTQTKTGAAAVGDPRIALVRQITHAFATNAKYKTATARVNAIKTVAKGKTTLSQLTIAELTTLKGKIK